MRRRPGAPLRRLRRLYGDAGYARLRAARVAVVGLGGVGSWAVEALARSGVAGAGADRPGPRRRIQHQPPGAGAGPHARPGQGAGAARAHGRHPPRLRGARRSRSSSTRDNWPALLPHAGRRGHRRLRPGARQGGDGGLGAGRAACRSSASARPAASAWRRRSRSTTWPPVTHDPLLASLRQRLRREHGARAQRPHRRCAACSRARRWPRRPQAMRADGRRQPQLPRLRLERHRDRHLRHGRGRRGAWRNCCASRPARPGATNAPL